jgi:tetratricopeptide (TPR) repeat protein
VFSTRVLNSPVLPANLITPGPSLAGNSALGRRLFLVLAAIALIYAFLAGLRTLADPDLGWQMATGRWVAQHHRVPAVDVLSYTASGQPWIYPVGSGMVFYVAYLLGGYALISWLGVAACCGTVALLLRRGSAVSAGLAILAVFPIAARTSPRAEMFTVVLFAAFLSLLWENYQTGRAPLWLLPLLMFAWVNLHLGFVAGLALIAAYVGVELSETIFGEVRRRAAVQRLRRAAEWLGYTALATLFNPWGWGIYRALVRQERAMSQQQLWIMEWAKLPLSWSAFSSALWLRQTKGAIYLLLVIAVIAAAFSFLQSQLGAAILLLAAAYPAVRHVRLGALFTCVVVVAGGPVLSAALESYSSHIRSPRMRLVLAGAAVAILAVLALLRSFDVVTNRYYFQSIEASTFGAGLGWWFPQRAAEFVERANLPPEIFNSYGQGGYLAWRLGPRYRDYVDGRAIPFGASRILRSAQLLQVSPDSDMWQQEAERYNINTLILPLTRFDVLPFGKVSDFCNSRNWRPVYLDETSVVFVRVKPETEEFIRRAQVDCATALLPAGPLVDSASGSFNQWANAASLLAALGHNSEALSATDNALMAFPDSGFTHSLRGDILSGMGRRSEAEKEYVAAVSLEPGEVTWSSLADFWQREGRIPEAIHARQQAVRLSWRKSVALVKLANMYIEVGQPKSALQEFDKAMRNASGDALAATGRGSLRFEVAQGRAAACATLGDLKQATSFAEEAVAVAPDAADAWSRLAKLYQMQGQFADVYRAEERAAALGGNQSH